MLTTAAAEGPIDSLCRGVPDSLHHRTEIFVAFVTGGPNAVTLGVEVLRLAGRETSQTVARMTAGSLHHIELWVPSLDRAIESYGWILKELGYANYQAWENGRSWRSGGMYIIVEESPALTASEHERLRPGLNHLAFHAGSTDDVDRLVEQAPRHGWQLIFADLHPHAGGPAHYAAFLENRDGFEVELVADT